MGFSDVTRGMGADAVGLMQQRGRGCGSAPRWGALAVFGVLTFGCGASALERAALQADLGELKQAVKRAQVEPGLTAEATRALALAVMRRELAARPLPTIDGEVPSVVGCEKPMSDTLGELAAGEGDVAAWAALSLLDAGLRPPSGGLVVGPANHAAVRARRAVGVAAGPRRRRFMLDGDRQVRQAALRAAGVSADTADASALLEAARLDPDPVARTLAVRALSVIGGSDVVLGLVDVWDRADADLKLHILEAWASPALLDNGGSDQLLEAVRTAEAALSVMAGLELFRTGSAPAGLAEAVIEQALRGDDLVARFRAIDLGPWSVEPVRQAVVALSTSSQAETRALSLLRMAREGQLNEAGHKELRLLAEDKGGGPSALVALSALAEAGDQTASGALNDALSASSAAHRALAAFGLIRLGNWNGVAAALADDSPVVRTQIACFILAGSRDDKSALGPAASPSVVTPLAVLELTASH